MKDLDLQDNSVLYASMLEDRPKIDYSDGDYSEWDYWDDDFDAYPYDLVLDFEEHPSIEYELVIASVEPESE